MAAQNISAPKQKKQTKAERVSKTKNLRDFALAFFDTFGAQTKRLDRRKHGAIQVDLPEPMVAHFGRPSLQLVFQNAEVTSDVDLVAYGSRVFDQIMSYLDRQGALTVQSLPSRHNGADELLRAVHPRNSAIAGLQLTEQKRPLYIFNWHITYRADDKREELYTVVVDEHGRRVHAVNETTGAGEKTGDKGENVLDLTAMLADAEPAPLEKDEEGNPLPPKLPPMTQLTRLAENARKYALYHADVRCISHEAEILPRLHKVLARLTGYYQQQIEEVYDAHDPEGEKRQALEGDLQRKIVEEVENHRLRVQVRLFSYALVHVPVANAQIRLSDGKQERTIDVTRNRYTGALRRPTCEVCAQPITDLMLCRNGHVVDEGCSLRCQSCTDVLCETCGLHACPDCGRQNCETCSRYCWACGERACPDHISRCPVCEDETCHACQAACAECGERQCRSHLRADGVSGELLCARCAVRCTGCGSYTSKLETCTVSGQRFCVNCIVSCTSCGKRMGPNFYITDVVDGQPYCTDCLHTCPTCNRQSGVLLDPGCVTCGRALCGHCRVQCVTCGDALCAEHATACFQCGSPLCEAHCVKCAHGHEILCGECAHTCAICKAEYCQQHSATCEACLQEVCEDCIRRSGLCDTCAQLTRFGVDVIMPNEPIFADPRIENIWDRHLWTAHSNDRYKLYLGVDSWMRFVLVVAEGEKVLHIRRGPALLKLLEGR